MAETVLALEGVMKAFGDVVAVDRISFSVARGEFVTLLGPSGCGKTTTLRLIAGFMALDGGSLSLRGRVVNDVAPYERDIGVVFQSYALFPHMTVAANVGFGLRMRRVDKESARKRIRDALGLVKLAGLEERFPQQLSGGQQQRVALARALVIEPSLLLMDEPMSNLDALLRAEMQLELRQIVERAGVTTINVTHNQEEAMSMSDRVIVMSRGRVEQMGTPTEVYYRPSTEFVANFLGRSNLLTCRIDAVDGEVARATTESGHPILLTAGKGQAGDRVTVQVRPEAIEIVAPGSADALPGRIVQRAFMGAFFEYVVDAIGRRFLVRAGGAVHNRLYEPGAEVGLRWPATSAVEISGAGGTR